MPKRVRRLAQLGFVGVIVYVGIGRQLEWPVPSVDALCPFGALEGLWYLLIEGRYLGKIFPSNMVIGIAFLVSVLLAGAAFCGWICPFGALQDAVGALRKKLGVVEIRIPTTLERKLGMLRFLVLGLVLAITVRLTELVFAEICPYRTAFSFDWLFAPSSSDWLAYAIVLIIIGGSLFVHRFFCRLLCPLGAVISLLSHLSMFKVRRDEGECLDCTMCARACSIGLEPHVGRTPGAGCTLCGECLAVCPRPLALQIRLPWVSRWKTHSGGWVPLLSVVIFVSVIVAGNTAGYLQTTGKSQAYFSAAGSEEKLHPEDIRGWMSLHNIWLATGVPLDYLYDAAGLSRDFPADTPLRELEANTHVETDDIRKLVAQYYTEHPDQPKDTAEVTHRADDGLRRAASTQAGIAGSMTLSQVAQQTDISSDVLLDALGLPEDTALNETIRALGIEVIRVEYVVGEYQEKPEY